MKIYIIIIQFIFIQQFFFAAKANTYNNTTIKHSNIKSVTPAVNDSVQKVLNVNRLQIIGAFPNIYPDVKYGIKSMAEPEITGFYEAACINNRKQNNIK